MLRADCVSLQELPQLGSRSGSAQARCTERMNLWQSCENSAATLAASSAPRRLATEAASQPVTAALAASSACGASQKHEAQAWNALESMLCMLSQHHATRLQTGCIATVLGPHD